jgi:hypothetical protein
MSVCMDVPLQCTHCKPHCNLQLSVCMDVPLQSTHCQPHCNLQLSVCMDVPLQSTHCQPHCNLHTTCHSLGTTLTAHLTFSFQTRPVSNPPPLNILTVPNWLAVKFHNSLIGSTVNILNNLFLLAVI